MSDEHDTASQPETPNSQLPGPDWEPSPIRQEAMRALQEWVALAEKDNSFRKAMHSLIAHQSDATLREVLAKVVPMLACLAIPRKARGSRRLVEEVWASKTGKTWKALREFPARLRRTADEIQRVNDGQFLSPSMWMKKDNIQARIVKGHFLRLPGVLRLYATWLEMLVLEKVPLAWKRVVPPGHPGHSPSLFHLSYLVKATTGRFHDREVCDLLDAAANALGIQYQFDPALLAQARGRHKKKRPAT